MSTKSKLMLDALPEDMDEIIEELEYHIAKEGLCCADTFRVTPEFKDINEHLDKVGCCGIWEGKITCKSGRTYYIGLNHGH